MSDITLGAKFYFGKLDNINFPKQSENYKLDAKVYTTNGCPQFSQSLQHNKPTTPPHPR